MSDLRTKIAYQTKTMTFQNPFEVLEARLHNIEALLTEIKQQPAAQANQPEDEVLTVEQAAVFLKLAKQTVYGLISKGQLPVMKRSKRCYFSKAELIAYLKEGRRSTHSEIASNADQYLIKKKKG